MVVRCPQCQRENTTGGDFGSFVCEGDFCGRTVYYCADHFATVFATIRGAPPIVICPACSRSIGGVGNG